MIVSEEIRALARRIGESERPDHQEVSLILFAINVAIEIGKTEELSDLVRRWTEKQITAALTS